METLFSYFVSFFTVVVVGCSQRVNWDSCFPIHTWMLPYVEDLRRFNEVEPYALEKAKVGKKMTEI